MRVLMRVRPQFLEEYETHEAELKQHYDSYLEKYRNLQFLESELHKYHMAELEKKSEHDKSLKKMQQRLREEELRILRGEHEVDEAAMGDGDVYDSGRSAP